MRTLSTILQLLFFAIFVAAYIFAIIPAALIVAMRKPVVTPARAKTTIGYGNRRIY